MFKRQAAFAYLNDLVIFRLVAVYPKDRGLWLGHRVFEICVGICPGAAHLPGQ